MSKRKIFMVLTLVISCFLSNTAAASTSVTTVNGCISPTYINVSAPAKVIFSIDPNAGARRSCLKRVSTAQI
jgi:hypothetical protein